jgi:hypothetical protein
MFPWKTDTKLPVYAKSSHPKSKVMCFSGKPTQKYPAMRPQTSESGGYVLLWKTNTTVPGNEASSLRKRRLCVALETRYKTTRLYGVKPPLKNDSLYFPEMSEPMYNILHCVKRRRWRDNSPRNLLPVYRNKICQTNEHAAIMFMSIVGAHKQGLHGALTVEIERNIFLRINGVLNQNICHKQRRLNQRSPPSVRLNVITQNQAISTSNSWPSYWYLTNTWVWACIKKSICTCVPIIR